IADTVFVDVGVYEAVMEPVLVKVAVAVFSAITGSSTAAGETCFVQETAIKDRIIIAKVQK
ncbi:MAG TPA: hypothetical protein PK247_06740, partial [Candidatus Goldiibacteriota bacterium]|nr:hypothetical protein [Candidatus Goldiibacteriota bacterium]